MKCWVKSCEPLLEFGKLPKKAQEYLRFIERESGAVIGMISTGPDRDQTMFMPEFEAEMLAGRPKSAAKTARAR